MLQLLTESFGSSKVISKVLRQAERVAPTDTTVLLSGETGTGKELLARAIHERSARSDRPLLKVDCAALAPSLIESELFGHERGAFTGAATRRVGRFELADGASIFLDEIAELPLELQAKLLWVLQEGEFERLGSSKTIKVNVRVLAATNHDLQRALQERKFREDLYFRLSVYPIHLPPLRERKEDIRGLAARFLSEAGRPFEIIPQDVMDELQSYNWPGNVRELQNVIERSVIFSAGGTLRLPQEWRSAPFSQVEAGRARLGPSTAAEPGLDSVSLREFERVHICRVLEQTHWRIEGSHGAAAILGVNPSTLTLPHAQAWYPALASLASRLLINKPFRSPSTVLRTNGRDLILLMIFPFC
ncbi:MAG: sigma-54 interaction domain-containing protein [Candidatus Binatia bacterium]